MTAKYNAPKKVVNEFLFLGQVVLSTEMNFDYSWSASAYSLDNVIEGMPCYWMLAGMFYDKNTKIMTIKFQLDPNNRHNTLETRIHLSMILANKK